ncbi:proprotein convertase P-domain-containing protein [Pseudoalteromonas aliena]|uniref:proprotein convertase P-domain-containing protein n=1 Tax=Pseudoalteromonas aliena TaxID=247523 RepID=UPI00202A6BEE|nr:proprotein convertase P-domain-containing protein [Pseudoalteromonas aliena]
MPFHNANLSTDNASFWNMLVSAYNANGKLASYSSVGANIFLTAPGGENAQSQAGIVTTDMSGCAAGFNTINSTIDIPLQNTGLDSHCDATASMYGTSAAAANTSGAIALVMSANPQLDARTIKHILATTARKLDGNNTGVDINFTDANGDAVSYNAIPGWQQNAAGYNVHTFYGLGAIDIDAAVAMAQQTTALLPTLQVSDWHTANTELTIPDANVNGVQDTLAITDNLTIEAVQLKLSIDHTRMRDLAVELISPSGTRSVLLSPRTGLINVTGPPVQNALLLSQHFYGESAAGQWQIRLIDTDNGTSQTLLYNEQAGLLSMNDTNNSVDGTVLSWSLRFYGH